MRNNAAYLPESPIVYIILPKSIRNRASFTIFVFVEDRMRFGNLCVQACTIDLTFHYL